MRRYASFKSLVPVALSLAAVAGCSADAKPSNDGPSEDAFSSNQATLLDFEFDAELSTDSSWNDKQTIEDQLLYTIGHLNADNSVGRLDKLTLSNITNRVGASAPLGGAVVSRERSRRALIASSTLITVSSSRTTDSAASRVKLVRKTAH